MFIQPSGRKRSPKQKGGASGLVLIGFGALIFLYVIQEYTQRVMPSVRMAQAAAECFGYDGGHAGLRPAAGKDEFEIRSIVTQQVGALKRGDFAGAMRCLSISAPDVTAAMYENFLESRYPENAAPRSIEFVDGAMIASQDYAFQRVDVTGRDGATVRELYLMVLTADGWRIRRFRVITGGG